MKNLDFKKFWGNLVGMATTMKLLALKPML